VKNTVQNNTPNQSEHIKDPSFAEKAKDSYSPWGILHFFSFWALYNSTPRESPK
jgi:hypothetical protein